MVTRFVDVLGNKEGERDLDDNQLQAGGRLAAGSALLAYLRLALRLLSHTKR